MTEYRAYIAGDDRHFIRVIHLDCSDDETAKKYANQLADGREAELWEGKRKIARFGSKSGGS